MSEYLSRSYECDISVRNEAGGRTIYGIIVPFERVARVSDGGPAYDEAFQRGAFAKHIAERTEPIKLLSQHRHDRDPLGRSTLLREDAAGLYGEFWTHDTTKARDAVALAADGALSFSIGFRGIKATKRDGVLWRTEASIREASLVTYPAYMDALVGGVRALGDDVTSEALAEAFGHLPDYIVRQAFDLAFPTSATTPDGEPERTADEPADATRGDTPADAKARIQIALASVTTTP